MKKLHMFREMLEAIRNPAEAEGLAVTLVDVTTDVRYKVFVSTMSPYPDRF